MFLIRVYFLLSDGPKVGSVCSRRKVVHSSHDEDAQSHDSDVVRVSEVLRKAPSTVPSRPKTLRNSLTEVLVKYLVGTFR